MKKLCIASALVWGALFSFAGELDHGYLVGKTDKARAIDYAPGEEMTFTLRLVGVRQLPAGRWFVQWNRYGDDGKTFGEKVPASLTDPIVVKTSLDRAGFVRVRAVLVDEKGRAYRKQFTGDRNTPEGKAAMNRFERTDQRIFFDGGAGVKIDELRSYPEPADFDAFWASQYVALDKVPVKAERREVRSGNPKNRVFALSIDCAGVRPVTGYLSVPKAVDEGKTFPARLETHGYSGDRCTHGAPGYTRDDEIVLNINAHGLKLVEFGGDAEYTKWLRTQIRSNNRSYAFDPVQNSNRETAYFKDMVLRVKRGLQYLKTVKGWNGRDLIASGGSQGGLQTIWAAGCGEGVTRAESSITWCCDMYTSGKLRLDPKCGLASDGWYIAWTDAMGYFDAANFAKRIPSTCLTIVPRAGLGDYCCPPTGVAKMYNNVKGPKRILWVQGSTHGYVPPQADNQSFTLESASTAVRQKANSVPTASTQENK